MITQIGHWYTRLDNNSIYFTKSKNYKIVGILRDREIHLQDDSGGEFSFTEEDYKKHFKKAKVSIKDRTLYVGCVLVNEKGCEYKVLSINDEIVVLSYFDDFEEAGDNYTYQELQEDYKVKEGEEIEELTVEEVCKQLGKTIKIIK